MKIINLYAENLKRLTAVEISPDGNLVQITGKNGQGKTSVLDAIWWALDGVKNVQAKPIRDGEEKAVVRLDMGEVKVTRRFTAQEDGSYTTSITVENAEGARFSSPQSMLDKMLGELTFDPLAFMRMKDRDQVLAMRSLVPDFDFEQAEASIKIAFDKRTESNRTAKDARAAANQIELELPDTIPERVNFSDLSKEWNDAHIKNAEIDQEAKRQSEFDAERTNVALEIKRLTEKLEKLDQMIEDFDPIPDRIDTDAIRAKMDTVEANNQIAENAERRDFLLEQAKEAEQLSEALTRDIDRIKAEAQGAIAGADMPIDGLSIDQGVVHLQGIPFAQASDAQQLQASIGIAMALNPKLKVIRVRDGSLLDDDAMTTLTEMAEKHDYQIWIERVDSSGTIGFVMEDGHLKGQVFEKAAEPEGDNTAGQPAEEVGKETYTTGSLFDGDRA